MNPDTRGLWTVGVAWLALLWGAIARGDFAVPAVATAEASTAQPITLEASPPETAPPPSHDPPAVDKRAISIGDTSDGALWHGARLEESPALGILPKQLARDIRYGSEQMVAVLGAAAQSFHARTGRRMWVGHLSRRDGGDIAYSVSHNSGRDADIAFCHRSKSGKPVDPTELVPMSGDGTSEDGRWTFDVACSWEIVKALIAADGAALQYLFVAGSLEGMLIQHAVLRGEPPALVDRAGQLMLEPARAAPHNDHFHLRVYCAERDVRGGCVNSGKIHPWTDLHEDARSDAIASAVMDLDDPNTPRQIAAIEQLATLKAHESAVALGQRLDDATPDVQRAAARALALLGGDQAARMLSAQQPTALRLAAVDAIAGARRLDEVPLLIEILVDEDAQVRQAARAALERLTGRDDANRKGWRIAWRTMERAPRRIWLAWAFRVAGYQVQDIDQSYTWELVRALTAEDRLARHAAEALSMLYNHDPSENDRSSCNYWLVWLGARADLYPLGDPPARTTRACAR